MATIINGDGIVTAEGTSTTQGRLRLGEDTDNGSNYVELQAPASVASNLTFTLPSADGTNGQVLQTNGSGTLSFAAAGASIVRSARTSNTILGVADKGNLIEATSGTYTQTITAAATLGSGWWCYVSNAGSGFITLDPNSSETITVNQNALTTWVLWPNEIGLLICNGSNFFYYSVRKGFCTVTVSGTPSSIVFNTGVAYRNNLSLSWLDLKLTASNQIRLYVDTSTSPSNTASIISINSSVSFNGGTTDNFTLSTASNSGTAIDGSGEFKLSASGVVFTGSCRYTNTSSQIVYGTYQSVWTSPTLSTITDITIAPASTTFTSGTVVLQEL